MCSASMMRLISTARRTLVCFSSGLRSPRSAKTLPEPGVIALLFVFSMSHLIIVSGHLQPLANQFHILVGRLHPFRRLLLKGMQNVHSDCKLHCIDGPICVPAMIFYNLQHARAFTLPGVLRSDVCRRTGPHSGVYQLRPAPLRGSSLDRPLL